MLAKIKLAAYGTLFILALWFAWGFYVNYTAVAINSAAVDLDDRADAAMNSAGAPAAASAENSNAPVAAQSDNPSGVPTNSAETTNTSETNASATDSTNSANAGVSASDSTNKPAPAKAAKKAKKKTHIDAHQTVKIATADTRRQMISDLVALVFIIAALAAMFAYDFSRRFASRTVDALFDDDGPATKDPEYEHAEQVWAEGHPMEAVEMMRAYLKKNPREQYVALRIAEIYEKDFGNFLAAAMEYEEVLKKKLHPDRWGWAAIHLCNLYTKLGRMEEREALLRRIVDEHPETSSAKKARKHLGLPEEDAPAAPSEEAPSRILNVTEPIKPSEPPPDDPHLPKGFRRKK
jgi:hypothetical protein